MLKIRLHGKEDEIEKFVHLLEDQPKTEILSQSTFYQDRGKSVYVRKYLEIEMDSKRDSTTK